MTCKDESFPSRNCIGSISESLSLSGREIWIDGSHVGNISIEEIEDDAILVRTIDVHPEFQGHGLGSRILSMITQAADDHDCRILLEAFWHPGTEDGGWLSRWYVKHGFEVTDEPDDHHLAGFERRPSLALDPEPEF